MRLVLLAALALISTTADATASPACFGPWIPTYRSPPGCPLVLVERDPTGVPPIVEVRRNGELVPDAMVDIVSTQIHLDVDYYGVSCDGTSEVDYVQSEPFVHHSIEITNTQPGDQVVFDQFSGTALIEEAGPCYVIGLPNPECHATQTEHCPEPAGDELGGCSTSHGSAGLPILLALAALRRRRR